MSRSSALVSLFRLANTLNTTRITQGARPLSHCSRLFSATPANAANGSPAFGESMQDTLHIKGIVETKESSPDKSPSLLNGTRAKIGRPPNQKAMYPNPSTRIWEVSNELDLAVTNMHNILVLGFSRDPFPNFLELSEKVNIELEQVKMVYRKLSEVLNSVSAGDLHMYHSRWLPRWSKQTHKAVSVVVMLHWFETKKLLTPAEVEEKLGIASLGGIIMDDYFLGLRSLFYDFLVYAKFERKYKIHQVQCLESVLNFLKEVQAECNNYYAKTYDSKVIDYDVISTLQCRLWRISE